MSAGAHVFEDRYVDYGLVGYEDKPGRERYAWERVSDPGVPRNP